MAARALVCLYATDCGALTAADLVQSLRVSPASVSHAVNFLEQQGIVRRERTPGERRERYVIDDDIWLRSTLAAMQMNDALIAASQRGAEVLGTTTRAGSLRQYQAPTGATVPLLQISPSKTDRERVIPADPDLVAVLARIIRRIKGAGARPDPRAPDRACAAGRHRRRRRDTAEVHAARLPQNLLDRNGQRRPADPHRRAAARTSGASEDGSRFGRARARG
ncbi:GbsR/MarR family transcriptional regulator [Kitasatospora sp. NPDC018058]|uniref:GbsR/MarR family transcriptional regulator n=1 Tax=Kitasatospora sp. NPDC018058 TaxID=3364025 RepID=UPI0037BF83F4